MWRWNFLRACGEGYFGCTNNQVYIDWMFVYVCLQLSGCVNLIFCTFICWDSLVSSAAIAEDGSNILHGVPCRQGHCYSGACAVVTVQGFAQPSFGDTNTVPSVKQCLSSQHRGTQSSQLQLSAVLSGDTKLWLFPWVEKQRKLRKLCQNMVYFCGVPPVHFFQSYVDNFDENSNWTPWNRF